MNKIKSIVLAIVIATLGLTATAQIVILSSGDLRLSQTWKDITPQYSLKYESYNYWHNGSGTPYAWERQTAGNSLYYNYYNWPNYLFGTNGGTYGKHWYYYNGVLQPGYPKFDGPTGFDIYTGGLGEFASFTNTVSAAPGFTNTIARTAKSTTLIFVDGNVPGAVYNVTLATTFTGYDTSEAGYYGPWGGLVIREQFKNKKTLFPGGFQVYNPYNGTRLPYGPAGELTLQLADGLWDITPLFITGGGREEPSWYTWSSIVTRVEEK